MNDWKKNSDNPVDMCLVLRPIIRVTIRFKENIDVIICFVWALMKLLNFLCQMRRNAWTVGTNSSRKSGFRGALRLKYKRPCTHYIVGCPCYLILTNMWTIAINSGGIVCQPYLRDIVNDVCQWAPASPSTFREAFSLPSLLYVM